MTELREQWLLTGEVESPDRMSDVDCFATREEAEAERYGADHLWTRLVTPWREVE